MASSVKGMAAFRARVLSTLPQAAKDKMRAADQKNAQEFHDLVARIVPRDGQEPDLAETLEMKPGDQTETAFLVTIGGDAAPYPMHLEGGHRTKGGTHVPAEPFWYPALRVLGKRAHGRSLRALNDAVKLTAAGKLAQN